MRRLIPCLISLLGLILLVAEPLPANARGEVTADGQWTYTRNLAGQITQVSGVGTYVFDGNGKRIKKTSSAGTEYALYDQDEQLVYIGTACAI